ncbi:hypothetical protein [Phenylobacterium sp.]|uniref:hypothetical protein n=1 Tax=Phenylobacterium sp. TaxID=1871053 RepID=UPI002F4152B4
MPNPPEAEPSPSVVRPVEAALAPYRLYAQAFATAQEAAGLWMRAWLHAWEGAQTLALQQMQLARGLSGAMTAARPSAAEGSEADPQAVAWPLGRIAAAAARVAQAFDSDPRWTARPTERPRPH